MAVIGVRSPRNALTRLVLDHTPTTISALPSPLRSPTATVRPPEKFGLPTKTPGFRSEPSWLNVRRCGPPPDHGTTAISALPSLSRSPAATLTPPLQFGLPTESV